MSFTLLDIILATGWALTLLIAIVWLHKNARLQRQQRRDIKKQKSIRECVLNLLGKSSQTLKDALDKDSFLTFYADYTAQSLAAQSAAFFLYDKTKSTVQASAVIGLFPALFRATPTTIESIAYSPGRVRSHLMNTHFSLTDTPFTEAIKSRYTVIFNEKNIKERLRCSVVECWTMMVVPVFANNDVVGVLALANKKRHEQFDQDDLNLANKLAEMAGIALAHILSFHEMQEKRRIDSELSNAAIIQHHLLPQSIPQYDSCELAVYFHPANRLGGDYYDFIRIDDDHLGIIMADVSGKSVTAGLVMATVRSLVAALTPGQLSPASVLCSLNTHLLRLIPEEMFVSMTYAIFNTKTRIMTLANAGHEPSLRCLPSHDVCCLAETSGIVLGMVENDVLAPTIHDESSQLVPGEHVLFYTDGVTEAHNLHDEEFGRNELAALLRLASEMDAQTTINFLVHRLNKFIQGNPPYDDITLVILHVTS